MSLILPSYQSGFAPRDYEPAYPSLWQGCVAAYAPLLGPTGLVLKDSVGKNDGVLTNGPTWDISGGRYALGFDGVNDYVEVPDRSPLNFTNALTVSVWVYPRANLYQFVQSKRNTNLVDPPYSIARFTSNNAFFLVTNSNVNYKTVFSSTNSVPTNSWTHIVGTFNGSADTRIYINAKLDVASTDSGGVAFSQVQTLASPVLLGKYETISANFSFNGLIDDCRFYNRALSESEIKLLSTRRGIAHEPIRRRRTFFRGFSPKKKLLQAKITSTIPGSYQTGYAPRDGEPVYPELWKNCVGAWSAGLGPSNILRDNSPAKNDGSLVNGPTYQVSGGQYALGFDGVDDYVAVPDSAALRPAASVSITFNIRLNTVSGVQRIVDKQSATPFYGYSVFFNGNKLYANVAYDANSVEPASTTTFTTGVWYHVAVVYGGGRLKYFVNGLQDTDNAASGTIAYTVSTDLAIGKRTTISSSFANAQIDDIRIYDRALSPNEIKLLASQRNIAYAHRKKNIAFRAYDPIKQVGVGKITSIIPGGYHTGVGGVNNEPAYPELTKGLVGGWCPSLGVTGGLLRDNSGQGNHGTLTNGPTWQISDGKYALDFDGVNDWVNLGDVLGFAGSNQTISISWWAYLKNANDEMRPFSKCRASSTNSGWEVASYVSGGVYYVYWFSANALSPNRSFVQAVASGSASQWRHYAVTFHAALGASAGTKIYENTTLLTNQVLESGSTTIAANAITSKISASDLTASPGTPTGFTPSILDDIRIYNRILSPSEVQLLASRRGIGYDYKTHRSYSKTQSSGLLKRLILTGQT